MVNNKKCMMCNSKITLIDGDENVETINYIFLLCLDCQLILEDWVNDIINERKKYGK